MSESTSTTPRLWGIKLLLFAAIGVAAAGGLFSSAWTTPRLLAQSATGQASPAPAVTADYLAFDAASIKPSDGTRQHTVEFQPGGRVVMIDLRVRSLIKFAYQLSDPFGPGRGTIIGAPPWIDSARFDVEAKAEGNPTPKQESVMLQALLADRFKLVLHHETRQLPIYALVVAKAGRTGPQLVAHAADNSTCTDLKVHPLALPTQPGVFLRVPVPCGGGLLISPGHIATESTMAELAKNLSWYQQIDRAVVDRTGLAGTFDMALDYEPYVGAVPSGTDKAADLSLPATIFEALREQLGLKLESRTGPVDVLVIDHVEEPSAN